MLRIVICICVHTDTVPTTCKINIFPIHPFHSPDLLTPSPASSTTAGKQSSIWDWEKREEVKELKSELDRWKHGELASKKAVCCRAPGGQVLPDTSQCFQCCSGRQNKIPATKQHKGWRSSRQQFSGRSHRALQTSWYSGPVQAKHFNRGTHKGMHQRTNKSGQIYLPAVGGRLQGKARGSLCNEKEQRKQSTPKRVIFW